MEILWEPILLQQKVIKYYLVALNETIMIQRRVILSISTKDRSGQDGKKETKKYIWQEA